MLIKGCLETPYLLTDRVFSFCVPHFQGTEKWNVFLPEQHAFSAVPYLLLSMARDKADGGRGDLRRTIDLEF